MAKKTVFNQKKFLVKIKDAYDIGFFSEEEAAFMNYVVKNYEELYRDATRYRTFIKMIIRKMTPETAKREEKNLHEMIDKEVGK